MILGWHWGRHRVGLALQNRSELLGHRTSSRQTDVVTIIVEHANLGIIELAYAIIAEHIDRIVDFGSKFLDLALQELSSFKGLHVNFRTRHSNFSQILIA